jgi:hypothetical protein
MSTQFLRITFIKEHNCYKKDRTYELLEVIANKYIQAKYAYIENDKTKEVFKPKFNSGADKAYLS